MCWIAHLAAASQAITEPEGNFGATHAWTLQHAGCMVSDDVCMYVDASFMDRAPVS